MMNVSLNGQAEQVVLNIGERKMITDEEVIRRALMLYEYVLLKNMDDPVRLSIGYDVLL
jgi:hypothetical protein